MLSRGNEVANRTNFVAVLESGIGTKRTCRPMARMSAIGGHTGQRNSITSHSRIRRPAGHIERGDRVHPWPIQYTYVSEVSVPEVRILDCTMPSRTAMGLFRRKVPSHLIRIHPDNTTSKDWVILLEAGTIVGPSPERIRVARSVLERKIVKKYNIWFRPERFLVVEGYDPRICAVLPRVCFSISSGRSHCARPNTGRGDAGDRAWVYGLGCSSN
jgi:hypothetical protein